MGLFSRVFGYVPSVLIARRNISRAKVRSALAVLAIVIGVVAIGAIGAGGAAFKQSQLDTIRDQGANSVYVFPGFDHPDGSFDREDLLAIRETVGDAGVVATRQQSVEWIRRAGEREQTTVTYLEDPRALYSVADGEIPANWRQSVVVSGEFADDHGVGVGDRLSLVWTHENAPDEERTYRVVAVLSPTQAFGASDVYLPIEESGNRQYGRVQVTTQSVETAEVAAEALRKRFNGRKDRIIVFEFTSLVRLLRTIVNGINLFLAGLGSISLLVAGVSIANTMLMAVIERREEIGVLRAVGYSKRDIVTILLVEAALLGVMGAGVGLAIALGVTMAANAVFLGGPFAFAPDAPLYLVAAVGFGIATSLVAGAYPAWRAANERPVEALRG